jgi:SAM-dependent methyltransferase
MEWLLARFPGVRSVLEVGCGTGHFAAWFSDKGLRVVGLERAPAMLGEVRRNLPGIPAVLGDAHRLPFRDGAMDLALFVTTLEFLDDPEEALAEAVRVARRGLLVVALNRWSLGGLSRRWGPQARQPLLGRARDHSLWSLRVAVQKAAGERLEQIRWTSTLFPACLWRIHAPVPIGEVIGMAAALGSLQYCASE